MVKEKQKILIIAGPTAIGKSDLAVQLAKRHSAEIISADSMQIYRGMDIGTGKVTSDEMQGIKHHLLNIVDVDKSFSVSDFVTIAEEKIKEISARNNNVIIVGGTGLYLNALINGYNLADTSCNEKIREKYKTILAENGNEFLHNLLKKCDPISADKISINDTKRTIRALEIFETTGVPKSKQVESDSESTYDSLTIILDDDRQILYERINARVDKMISLGLMHEVEKILPYKDCQSMQAIGYKELVEYFENNIELQTAIEKIKKNSCNYAKRQMTYFRWVKLNKCLVDRNETQKIYDICDKFYTMSDILQK